MLDRIGKKDVKADYIAKIQDRLRERNIIIEKNKKLRTLKKPEEYVFFVETVLTNEETKSTHPTNC